MNILFVTSKKIEKSIGYYRDVFFSKLGGFRKYYIDLDSDIEIYKDEIILFEDIAFFAKDRYQISKKIALSSNRKIAILGDYWLNNCEQNTIIKYYDIREAVVFHDSGINFINKKYKNIKNIYRTMLPFEIEKFNMKNGDPEYDFVFTGVVENIHPYRLHIHKNIDKLKEDGYNIYQHQHPGVRGRYQNQEIQYNDVIANSFYSICTPSVYNLSLPKYYEALLSGTAIFGKLCTTNEHDFIKKYAYESSLDLRYSLDQALRVKNQLRMKISEDYDQIKNIFSEQRRIDSLRLDIKNSTNNYPLIKYRQSSERFPSLMKNLAFYFKNKIRH